MYNQPSPIQNGINEVLTVADPAAAANFTTTLADNSQYQIQFITFRLTTSAVAATRIPILQLTRGASVIARILCSTQQILAETKDYTFGSGMQDQQIVAANVINGTLPVDLQLHGFDTIQSLFLNLQAGDQLSAIRIQYRRWPCPI